MIEFRSVSKRFADGTVAVDDFNLVMPSRKTTVLVGSSGSGKTTLLRMINRMVEPTSGVIEIYGESILARNPVELRRSIGYVMQNSGLLPHLRVIDNVATVPVLNGVPRKVARQQALELLDTVGLSRQLADRYPSQLSGGQQQRVGVARGLAADPNILLMDEPFGAVDPIVRAELQQELIRLQRDLDKTVVFVTHDIDEAVLLGDRVAVFTEGGRLLQYDTPAGLLAHPVNDEVATFVGAEHGLRRLSVTRIDADHLEPVDGIKAAEPASTVPIGATLEEDLASMLRDDRAMVGVTDGPTFVGVLTPAGVHRALRDSLKDGSP